MAGAGLRDEGQFVRVGFAAFRRLDRDGKVALRLVEGESVFAVASGQALRQVLENRIGFCRPLAPKMLIRSAQAMGRAMTGVQVASV